MNFINNSKFKIFIKCIFVVCVFLTIALTNGKTRKISPPETLITKLLYFPQNVINKLFKTISNDNEYFSSYNLLKEENEKLKNENEKLKKELIDYQLIKQENKTYKINQDTINMYESYEVVIANVIATGNNNWEEIFIIDKGTKDGIVPNQTVITKDGLVGYIYSCDDVSSKIVSILDATSSVSARASNTREEVVIKGNNSLRESEQLEVTMIPIGTTYSSGDLFETSGIGGLYPKGITIGKTIKFENKPNPLENRALIKTTVDFNKLETVAVIVSKGD